MELKPLFFCQATLPTPILNRKDFSYVFSGYGYGLLLDDKGLLRSLEMIAFIGSFFSVVAVHQDLDNEIYEVFFDGYKSKSPLYIDSRFVEKVKQVKNTKKTKPTKDLVISRLKKMISLPYVWGGNYSKGISKMLEFYPPKRALTSLEKANLLMKGVDCSGMLYEATEGFIPRNTSDLIKLSKPLDLTAKNLLKVSSSIEPLDVVVWKGHMIICLEDNNFIESRAHRGGVFVTEKIERLNWILEEEKEQIYFFSLSRAVLKN